MLEFFLYAFFVVATAVVYCEVLTAPGNILGWWDKLIHRLIKNDYILKPLGDCVYCFGGQLALWSYLIMYFNMYNIFYHVCFIMTVIFFIHIYKLIWN